MSISVRRVGKIEFLTAFHAARQQAQRVRNATSDAYEIDLSTTKDDKFLLGQGGMYGFIVKQSGELVALFSLIRGIGNTLVAFAVENGAYKLDCFDGYLVALYERHGFVATERQRNWTPGGPDVVYMHRHGGSIPD